MIKIESNQKGVAFIPCKHPLTVDKSADWGPGNHQQAPKGAFLKLNVVSTGIYCNKYEVSHLVQPKDDWSAPIGWIPSENGEPDQYDKAPIWVDTSRPLSAGSKAMLLTRDGMIDYEAKEHSFFCYNDLDGAPDMSDCWVQSQAELVKNYLFTPDGA